MILAVAAGFTAFSGLTMLLWNGILPAVLHVSVITFWQAAGILLLARLLLGGRRGRRMGMGLAGGCMSRNSKWEYAGRCQPQTAEQ